MNFRCCCQPDLSDRLFDAVKVGGLASDWLMSGCGAQQSAAAGDQSFDSGPIPILRVNGTGIGRRFDSFVRCATAELHAAALRVVAQQSKRRIKSAITHLIKPVMEIAIATDIDRINRGRHGQI